MAWGLAHISGRELSEWMAFARLEPFGEGRADWRAAMIASTIANAMSDGKKTYRIADFLPDFEQGEAGAHKDAMLGMVELLNTAFGGRDLRDKSEPQKANA